MRPKFQTQIAVFFRFRAGINLAEAAFSAIKRNIRRLNLQNSVKHAQINFLAAAWMQKNVGLKESCEVCGCIKTVFAAILHL